MVKNIENLQTDLRFLLAHGWKLIDLNTAQSPEGVRTQDFQKAARAVHRKLEIQRKIDREKSKKILLSPLTTVPFYKKFWYWWWDGEKIT